MRIVRFELQGRTGYGILEGEQISVLWATPYDGLANTTGEVMSLPEVTLLAPCEPTKIVANRNCQEIKLAGLNVGPFEEGNEYEIYNWTAWELEKSGIVHFREDENLNLAKLNKLQWSERVQTVGQILKLPVDFYPRLRRYLANLRKEAARSPEKMLESRKEPEEPFQALIDALEKADASNSNPPRYLDKNRWKNFSG
jgi:hypothetical protein